MALVCGSSAHQESATMIPPRAVPSPSGNTRHKGGAVYGTVYNHKQASILKKKGDLLDNEIESTVEAMLAMMDS